MAGVYQNSEEKGSVSRYLPSMGSDTKSISMDSFGDRCSSSKLHLNNLQRSNVRAVAAFVPIPFWWMKQRRRCSSSSCIYKVKCSSSSCICSYPVLVDKTKTYIPESCALAYSLTLGICAFLTIFNLCCDIYYMMLSYTCTT